MLPVYFYGAALRPLYRDDDAGNSDDGGGDFGGESPGGWSTEGENSGVTSAAGGDYGYGGNLGTDNGYTGDFGEPMSYSANGLESAPYGQYSGWDFNTYGWGSPTTGYASTPSEAAEQEAKAALAAWNADPNAKGSAAWNSNPNAKGSLEWSLTPVHEEEALEAMGPGAIATQGISPAAQQEWNSLGLQGMLGYNPMYTDLEGKSQVNYGTLANDVLSGLNNPFGTAALAMSGLGAAIPAIAGIEALVQDNKSGLLGTIGSALGGASGRSAGSILGSLFEGKDLNAVSQLANAALNNYGLGLAGLLGKETKDWDPLAQYAANIAEGKAQASMLGSLMSSLGLSNQGTPFGGYTGPTSNQALNTNSSIAGMFDNYTPATTTETPSATSTKSYLTRIV